MFRYDSISGIFYYYANKDEEKFVYQTQMISFAIWCLVVMTLFEVLSSGRSTTTFLFFFTVEIKFGNKNYQMKRSPFVQISGSNRFMCVLVSVTGDLRDSNLFRWHFALIKKFLVQSVSCWISIRSWNHLKIQNQRTNKWRCEKREEGRWCFTIFT